jgi:hypothetical protein
VTALGSPDGKQASHARDHRRSSLTPAWALWSDWRHGFELRRSSPAPSCADRRLASRRRPAAITMADVPSPEFWARHPIAAAAWAVRSRRLTSPCAVLAAAVPPRDVQRLCVAPTVGANPAWARFVGLVCDVGDPELYLFADPHGRTSLLSETITTSFAG